MNTRMPMKEGGMLMLVDASNPYRETVMNDYLEEVDREIERDTGQAIFRFDAADLAAPSRRFYAVAAVRAPGEPQFAAGLHVVEDGEKSVSFRGALVLPQFRGRGLMTELVYLVDRLERKRQPQFSHKAVVRVFPNGQVNIASLRVFEKAGFAVCQVGDYMLQNNKTDRHLISSVEHNGRIRFLVLETRV